MQKIKPKFEHLSQVQRTLQAAQNEVMQKPPISFAPMQARPLYSIAQEGTLKNIANEWRAHPEILTKSRALMVEALRHLNLSDELVLAAMARVPRHVFVDEAFYFRAYDDDALPIGHQQTISHPSTVARMLSLMRVGAERLGGACHRVLEIGTGCGYQAAVLACFVPEVYSIERIEPLYDLAMTNLTKIQAVLSYQPVVRFGDGLLGWSEVGGFDGIVLAAAGMSMPQGLLEQLRVGGVLVAPVVVNEKGAQQLVRVIRVSLREWQTEYLDAVHFVPLLEGTRR